MVKTAFNSPSRHIDEFNIGGLKDTIRNQFIEIETQRDFLEWIFENLVTDVTQSEAFELFQNQLD